MVSGKSIFFVEVTVVETFGLDQYLWYTWSTFGEGKEERITVVRLEGGRKRVVRDETQKPFGQEIGIAIEIF